MFRKVMLADEQKLRQIAKEKLESLYGSQEKAVREWVLGTGFKTAYICDNNNNIYSLLVLKADPSKKFIKISTFIVLNDYKGRGIGRKMLIFANDLFRNFDYKYVIVTVSENVKESVLFFKKHDFKIVGKMDGKYRAGISELVLKRKIQKHVVMSLWIKEQYLSLMLSGHKTLEARINYPNLREVKKGDIIRFRSTENAIVVEIVLVKKYCSFREMLLVEDVKRLLFCCNFEQALKIYRDIYPDSKVKKNGGVLAFEVKRVK